MKKMMRRAHSSEREDFHANIVFLLVVKMDSKFPGYSSALPVFISPFRLVIFWLLLHRVASRRRVR